MGKVTARHATQPREQNRLEQGNSRCASTFTGFVASVPSCKNAQIGESEEEDDLCAGHLRSQPPCTTLNITAIGGQAVLSYLAGIGPVNTATSTVFMRCASSSTRLQFLFANASTMPIGFASEVICQLIVDPPLGVVYCSLDRVHSLRTLTICDHSHMNHIALLILRFRLNSISYKTSIPVRSAHHDNLF